MRMIDADAIPWTDLNADMPNTKIKVLITFADKVNRMPTIEERKKGMWKLCEEKTEETFWVGSRCSECNYWKPMGQWNYCPNCGADMRG